MSQLIEKIIKERQSVKSFSDKAIPQADWDKLLAVIKGAPSSFGAEPYRVLIVERKNAALRDQLGKVMFKQAQVAEADKLMIFLSYKAEKVLDEQGLRTRGYRFAANVKGLTPQAAKEESEKVALSIRERLLKSEADVTAGSRMQAYLAVGQALVAATLLGVGSSTMEGFDRPELEALLAQHNLINPGETIAITVAFGYPASEKAYAHRGTGARVRDADEYKFTTI